MTFIQIYFVVVAGVLISIVLPILKRLLPTTKLAEIKMWETMRPYVVVGIFSLLTALLIVALTGDTLQDWKAAILAGYAWDSTLQKMAI